MTKYHDEQCGSSDLREIKHPVYRCKNCGKKVRLVKVERIVAKIVDEPQEGK